MRSLVAQSGNLDVEYVVVYDLDTPGGVLDELRSLAGSALRLVPYSKSFNFSEKCNLGVLASSGDAIVLLNDDIKVAGEDFLSQLVAPLFEAGVGATGARLLFSDSRIQHAGLAFYGDHLHHMFYRNLADDPGPFAALTVNRECSGLTGACLGFLRSTYDLVGGMSESLPVNFNDVDFSLKVAHVGMRLLWVAHATAFHFESQTRVPVVEQWEHEVIKTRWHIPERDLYMPDFGPRRLRAKKRLQRVPAAARLGPSSGRKKGT